MISLSDIPLADLGEYMDQYGGYLFGFSRKWVIDNGFNPVWYNEKSNPAIKKHKELLLDAMRKGNNTTPIFTLLLYYSSFMKDIEGPLHIKSRNRTYSNYRYYDEREYRYIPDFDILLKKNISPVLLEKEYQEYKDSHGNGRIDIKVPFSFNDVKIIIVKTDKQVSTILTALRKINSSISTHVFSHEEIKHNIIGTGHQIITESTDI